MHQPAVFAELVEELEGLLPFCEVEGGNTRFGEGAGGLVVCGADSREGLGGLVSLEGGGGGGLG